MKSIKRLHYFFKYLGTQNDYLYPFEGCLESHKDGYPFQKPHFWKTRFGVKTSWEVAKIIVQ